MYEELVKRNEKIIEAVIHKAEKVCPGSLALIGMSGSFQNGDIYDKSDLDLLILINDDRGWQLGATFIQKDLMVGHDIYCTKWDALEENAKYEDPNIAKLMDSKIVYCADEKYRKRLEDLRMQVKTKLEQPFSKEDYDKAYKQFKEAKVEFCNLIISDKENEALNCVGKMLYFLGNTVAMINKKYFKRSVKRCLDEIQGMENIPKNFCENVQKIVATRELTDIKEIATKLIKSVEETFKQLNIQLSSTKELPSASNLAGTYEEMFSNWRNKMYHAIDLENRYLAFMSLVSLEGMLSDISEEVKIGDIEVYSAYDPDDLLKTAKAFDGILNQYLENYKAANMKVNEYPNIDVFIKNYR